jgi:septal ring factor EnvC (AmiA/AmiB activator)
MKKLIVSLTFLTLITLLACGPSVKEKEAKEKAEKTKMDSVAKATESEIRQKMENKQALIDSIKNLKSNSQTMEMELVNAKADLAVANDKMRKIKEWQIGRTNSERENQIRQQTISIDFLEKKVNNLFMAIQLSKEKIRNFESELKKYQ